MRVFLGVTFCAFVGFAAANAYAQTDTNENPSPSVTTETTTTTTTTKSTTHKVHKKAKHKKAKTAKHAHKAPAGDSGLRDAQTHMIHLGYYNGHADGKMGPKTASGLKAFQRDNMLKITGTLTVETRKALVAADKAHLSPNEQHSLGKLSAAKPDHFFADHPDFYGHTDPAYADPMLMSRAGHVPSPTQALPNRYAQINLTEVNDGSLKHYQVTVNGQPVLQANNQSSIIGVSQTYQLPNEDVLIFSTFTPGDPVCAHRHSLLALRKDGMQMLPIQDCTVDYKAGVTYDSLIIAFPQPDSGRAVGSTFRYENGDLEKL